MKLQKIFAYDYKAKDGKTIRHHKYNLVIPEEAVGKVSWEGTEELEWEVDGEKLILKPAKKVAPVRKVEPAKKVGREAKR
jgi:bifunctional DNA-binding transcriptional regulator/antitoxin component of YhaV-PrlF toxin-antitoxin module